MNERLPFARENLPSFTYSYVTVDSVLFSPLLFSSLLLVSSELLSVLLSLLTASDDVEEDSETGVVSPTLPVDASDEVEDELQAVSAAVQEEHQRYGNKLYIS